MAQLKLKKLYLDVFLGLILSLAAAYVAIGQLTIVEQRISLPMVQACTNVLDEQILLQALKPALRGDEQCRLQRPCDRVQTLICDRSQTVTEVVETIVTMDIFTNRVKMVVKDHYQFAGYSDNTRFKIPVETLRLVVAYAIMILFGCAFIFALWRQSLLRQTFNLPGGSRFDQLVKPALYGVLVAMAIMLVSYGLSFWVELPDPTNRPIMNSLFTSFIGAVLAIIIGPLTEELVFRGVWLRFFVERGQTVKGALGVSAIFAWFHVTSLDAPGWQLSALALYMVVSLIFCRVYIKEKNLWSAVICHSAYNATLLIAYQLYS